MAVNIKFNEGIPEKPSFILMTRSGNKLGVINASNEVVKFSMNAADEISFQVQRLDDDSEERIRIWEQIQDFKLVWCREWNKIFEIYVEISDGEGVVKSVTGTGLGEAELSQINLHNVEINTEADLTREDTTYVNTTFYNPEDPKSSLINRLLEKAPHYSIGYVDPALRDDTEPRIFTFDGTSIYDAYMEIAEQYECIFEFNCFVSNGEIVRLINAFSIENYGENTNIFVSVENLTDDITYTTDAGAVKNCFKLEAGDDDMTAAVINSNPNGSDYLWYISDELKADMSTALRNKLNDYDALYASYETAEFDISSQLAAYNTLVTKYATETHPYPTLSSPIVGFNALSEADYEVGDFYYYLHDSYLPSIEMSSTTAQIEAAKLTPANFGNIGVSNYDAATEPTVKSAVESMAVVIADARYKVAVLSSSYNTSTHLWTGNFKVTNHSDETDTADSATITLTITGDYQTFCEQRIDKMLHKTATDDAVDIVSLFALNLTQFTNELKKYSLTALAGNGLGGGIKGCCQACLDILVEQGVADKESWALETHNLYDNLYVPYLDKMNAIEAEIAVRQSEIEIIEAMSSLIGSYIDAVHNALDFEKYLGTNLWKEFVAYRREDVYSNSNYISDGLSNAEIMANAKKFMDLAKDEIYKSATLQHSISATLANLLVMQEFQPIVDYFENGNWITISVAGNKYKLRLIEYEIDWENLETLSVTFSDVTQTASGIRDVESILNQASSMATSYGAVSKQAQRGSSSRSELDHWVSNGMALTNVQIVNNAENQNITWDENGLLARQYDDTIGDYDPKQLKIINKGVFLTDDNWITSRAGIGNFKFWNPMTQKTEESYGVIADTLVGNLILSQTVGVYNQSGSVVIDEDGLAIVADGTSGDNTVKFSIGKTTSSGTEESLYIDSDGNLVGKFNSLSITGSGGNVASKEDIENIEVGTRNLIRNTLTPQTTPQESVPNINGDSLNGRLRGSTAFTVAEHGMRDTVNSAKRPFLVFGNNATDIGLHGLTAGNTYTWSFDWTAKILNGSPDPNEDLYLRAVLYWLPSGGSTFNTSTYIDLHHYSTSNTSDRGVAQSGRCEFTFTIPNNAVAVRLGFLCNRNEGSYYASDDYVEFRNVKLEDGNKATSWSPAPEDITSAVSALDNKLDQEEVFNRLTNNGEDQGIYLTEDGDLYINGSYIQSGKVKAQYIETDQITVSSLKDGNNYSTTTQMNTAIGTAVEPAMQGWAVKVNYESFTKANNGELYIHGFSDSACSVAADVEGWVVWNGKKRTVSKYMINAGAYIKFNNPTYVVLRLSSATATTGTYYNVYYDSGWKYSERNASAYGGDWTWNTNTDIILLSYYQPSGEGIIYDVVTYNPPLRNTDISVSGGVATALTNAANAQSTANNAAPKSDAIARSQRIYYRKTASGTPAKNTTWLATSGTGYGNWSLSIPQLTSGTTKYPYLYTAVQTQTVSQQAAGTACTCSDVLLDDTTTVIDGGNIITGSVTANQMAADSINTNNLAIGDMTNYATANEDIPNSLPYRIYNESTGTWSDIDAPSTAYTDNYRISIETVDSNNYLVKKGTPTSQRYLMFTPYFSNPFMTDDELYYELYAKTAQGTSANVRLCAWGYSSIDGSQVSSGSNNGGNFTITETETKYTGTIKLTNANWSNTTKWVLLGFDNYDSTKVQIYVRKVIIRKKSDGNLIVNGSITVGAMSADAQAEVLNSNIEIGGRNLLLKTYADFGSTETSDRTLFDYPGWMAPTPNANNQTFYIAESSDISDFKQDTYITISYDIEVSGITAGTGGTFRMYAQDCYSSATSGTGSTADWNYGPAYGTFDWSTAPADGVYHFEKTYKLSADRSTYKRFIFSVRVNYAGAGKFRIRKLKLEKGNKTTDWTPAPEDVVEEGGRTATSFITYINAQDGIKVHNSDDTSDYVQINSDAISMFRNNTKVTEIADAKITLGNVSDTHTEITSTGYDIIKYDSDKKQNVLIAHFGYAAGNAAEDQQEVAPYYDLGIRNGSTTSDIGTYSVVEGYNNKASGYDSHAEGAGTTAAGDCAHAEGFSTIAGDYCHAEGFITNASGHNSHAEGIRTIANGYYSHAQNELTIAKGYAQTVIGRYNEEQGTPNSISASDYAFIIGNGNANNNRSNAFVVDFMGNIFAHCAKKPMPTILYGTCSTAAGTSTKTVVIDDVLEIPSLAAGTILGMYSTNTSNSSATNPEIKVENSLGIQLGTTAHIKYQTTAPYYNGNWVSGQAGYVNYYMFDGTYWVFLGHSADNNTTYTNMSATELTTGTATNARTISAKTLTDWMNTVSTYAYTTFTYNTGFTYYETSGNNMPYAHKWHRMVQLEGAFKCSTAQTSTGTKSIGKVPSGCEPLATVRRVQQGSNQNRFMLIIGTDGTIGIERYGVATDTAIPSGAWLNIACTYISKS